jgi:hypothetical protein
MRDYAASIKDKKSRPRTGTRKPEAEPQVAVPSIPIPAAPKKVEKKETPHEEEFRLEADLEETEQEIRLRKARYRRPDASAVIDTGFREIRRRKGLSASHGNSDKQLYHSNDGSRTGSTDLLKIKVNKVEKVPPIAVLDVQEKVIPKKIPTKIKPKANEVPKLEPKEPVTHELPKTEPKAAHVVALKPTVPPTSKFAKQQQLKKDTEEIPKPSLTEEPEVPVEEKRKFNKRSLRKQLEANISETSLELSDEKLLLKQNAKPPFAGDVEALAEQSSKLHQRNIRTQVEKNKSDGSLEVSEERIQTKVPKYQRSKKAHDPPAIPIEDTTASKNQRKLI